MAGDSWLSYMEFHKSQTIRCSIFRLLKHLRFVVFNMSFSPDLKDIIIIEVKTLVIENVILSASINSCAMIAKGDEGLS